MPITPRSLARLRKPLSFDFYGSTANVEYCPGAFTQDMLDKWNGINERLQASGEDEAAANAAALDFGRLFCQMIAAWDYCEDGASEDEPGPPVPLTPERLLRESERYPQTFPAFMLAIVNAVTADMRPKPSAPDSSGPSGATFSPRATSTSSPAARSRRPSASSSRRAGSVAAGRR